MMPLLIFHYTENVSRSTVKLDIVSRFTHIPILLLRPKIVVVFLSLISALKQITATSFP
jgi:hypothetical protein